MMEITEQMIRDMLANFIRRSEAIKMAGGISRREIENGEKEIPKGWAYDYELEYFVPPNFHFHDTVQ